MNRCSFTLAVQLSKLIFPIYTHLLSALRLVPMTSPSATTPRPYCYTQNLQRNFYKTHPDYKIKICVKWKILPHPQKVLQLTYCAVSSVILSDDGTCCYSVKSLVVERAGWRVTRVGEFVIKWKTLSLYYLDCISLY